MFKVGDKVVCVNIDGYSSVLKLYKTYTISEYNPFFSVDGTILLNEKGYIKFWSKRFISLSEYRKQKLKKLCLR